MKASRLRACSSALGALLVGCSCPPISGARGRVVDQEGAALSAATVEAQPRFSTTTDAEGRFEVPEAAGRPSGELCVRQYLRVGHPTCSGFTTEEPTQDMLIRLECSPRADIYRITGSVVDASSGAPLEGVKLEVDAAPDDVGMKAVSGTSDREGRFVVRYDGPLPAPRIHAWRGGLFSRNLLLSRDGCTSSEVLLVSFAGYDTGVLDVGTQKLRCP